MTFYLRVIVRNLAVNVVKDVGLGDAVGGGSTDPAHDATAVTEQLAIQSCQSTTGERELGCTVVRKDGVGVLEERDKDQPVVHPVIGIGKCTLGITEYITYQRYGAR